MFGLASLIADLLRPSQSVKEEYLDVEYDTAERWATVIMYSRVVEGQSSNGSSSSGDDGGGGGENAVIHHWALVVHFEDNSYRFLEGSPNEDGFLHAYYKKNSGDGMTKLRELGDVFTSPAKLRAIARDNVLNGSLYDLVDNCQDWAVRAAIDISADIGREASRIPRISPILSLARNVLGGNPMRILLGGNPMGMLLGRR